MVVNIQIDNDDSKDTVITFGLNGADITHTIRNMHLNFEIGEQIFHVYSNGIIETPLKNFKHSDCLEWEDRFDSHNTSP